MKKLISHFENGEDKDSLKGTNGASINFICRRGGGGSPNAYVDKQILFQAVYLKKFKIFSDMLNS